MFLYNEESFLVLCHVLSLFAASFKKFCFTQLDMKYLFFGNVFPVTHI